MSKLNVIFGDPEFGWIDVTIQSGIQTFNMEASDIYPSFFTLVEALHQLYLASGQKVVDWTLEPTEYDMHFVRFGQVITLDILCWPDSRRNSVHQDKVFSASGDYVEICLPFWRALRGLQGRFTAAELEKRWQTLFPHQELDALTVVLGKVNAMPPA